VAEGPDAASVEAFLEGLRVARRASPHTVAAYRRDLLRLRRRLAEQGVRRWEEADAGALRAALQAERARGLSPRSLARMLSALRAFLDRLVREGRLPANPARDLRPPKARRPLPEPPGVDQTARLLALPAGEDPLLVRDRALLELLYSSGLRLAELVGLDLQDLDLAEALVRVRGKGGKERVVPVGRRAREALEAWLRARPALAAPGEPAVFVGRGGGRLGPRAVQQRLRRWGALQGLPMPLHPHLLRHACATHLLESSGDLRAVQELLGHADIGTTQIYTRLDFQHLARVYDAAHPRARLHPGRGHQGHREGGRRGGEQGGGGRQR